MAINLDHTQSASITLRGPVDSGAAAYSFSFPNVVNPEAVLMVSGESTIAAISGLQAALNLKVNNSATGSAASYDVGTGVGEIPVLDNNGKIPGDLIPSVAIKDVFVVNGTGEITSLSNASIGDVAIATGDKLNYILCSSGASSYSTFSNWKKVQFEQQRVTCVNGKEGVVVLDGSDINLTGSSQESVDAAIANLQVTKADLICLTNYITTGALDSCLSCYQTATGASADLSNYQTITGFNSIMSGYSTTTEISNCLSSEYVPRTETGSAASKNFGVSSGEVVLVGNDGKIANSLVPKLAITDTFVVNDSGSLTSLSEAEKGDIAIATGSKVNYILSGSSYGDINDWAPLAVSLGAVQTVNGFAPNQNGNVTVNATGIEVVSATSIYNGSTVEAAITGLESRISGVEADYVTTAEASALLSGYVLTGTATGIFNTKSDNGHGHAISDVTGLTGCLAAITTFFTGAGDYSATQNGANPGYNEAVGDYAVALGYGAKAAQDYEVAHAAGYFAAPGDAQASKLVAKATTNSNSLTEVASITMDTNSTVLFSAYVLGKAGSKYASFKVEGAALKASTNASTALLENPSKAIFVNTNSGYFVDAVADTTNGKVSFKVSGDSVDEMKWVSDITFVKVKSS
jgi:hypothetical protein